MRFPRTLVVASGLLITACTSTPPVSLPDGAEACPDPRPQMCTMDYRPAYGYDQHGRLLGVYGNACGACGQDEVYFTFPKQRSSLDNGATDNPD